MSVSRGTRWVPPAPGKMPTFTSGSAIFTLSQSAATRPWQASDSSKAPPMQVPLIAETQGLPQVSSLRKSQVMRPALSNSILTALFGSFALLLLEKVEHAPAAWSRSAPPEKLSLPEVITAPLIAGVGGDLIDDLVEFVHHLFGEDVHRAVRACPR